MKDYQLQTTWGAYPIITFKGNKIASSDNEEQKKLKKNGKNYIYHEITLYRTQKNIVWHILLHSSDLHENGHSFVGYSSSKKQIVIELRNFNVLYGVNLPDVDDPEYNIKKEHKLQLLSNNYHKVRSDCLSKVKSLQLKLK